MKPDLTTMLLETDSMIHVVAAGAGMQLATVLMRTPGASAWLSGLSFPYDIEETDQLLGFKPASYVNLSNAIDLAMIAYMNAYRFAGKRTIGVGIEASIASIKPHKGDHRIHACVITPSNAYVATLTLPKTTGIIARHENDNECTMLVENLITIALKQPTPFPEQLYSLACQVDELKNETLINKILARPIFSSNGMRSDVTWNGTQLSRKFISMPGAYNPPHDSHFAIADAAETLLSLPVMYHITIDSPHKPTLIAQDVLERVKLLKRRNVLITSGDPLYIDKAKRLPGVPFIVGTDAVERLFETKWGTDVDATLQQFAALQTKFYVSPREIDGRIVTLGDVLKKHMKTHLFNVIFFALDGSWNKSASSTNVRNSVKNHSWR